MSLSGARWRPGAALAEAASEPALSRCALISRWTAPTGIGTQSGRLRAS